MADTFVVSGSGRATIQKDPDAVLDYTWDWTDYMAALSGDTIIGANIIADAGLTVVSSSVVGATVIAYIGGGVSGQIYRVTCRITTLGLRTDDRSFYIRVLDR
jgi:hypothetical protein